MKTPERLIKARETQIAKYGGIDGYRAEMRRRRSLVKQPTGFAIMSKEEILEAQRKSAEMRTKNAKAKRRAKKDNATQAHN